MNKYFAQIEVDSRMTKADTKKAKKIAKDLKKAVNGTSSALECMELETENTYQVTTYRDGVVAARACCFTRITSLTVEVSGVQNGNACLEVSWLAEGRIDYKSCVAKIITYATWKDGWYVWDNCEDNGAPKAPYAEIYTRMM